ncbi:hypothetical protein BDV59DRAFT_4393 [Aspergillus ambiguus]|uniref:uncharacterized protein n=1 Tax=Aspergillus ambiguus TaxID=176160 RepID=UPI003CCE037C
MLDVVTFPSSLFFSLLTHATGVLAFGFGVFSPTPPARHRRGEVVHWLLLIPIPIPIPLWLRCLYCFWVDWLGPSCLTVFPLEWKTIP